MAKREIEDRNISELERVVLESAAHVGIDMTEGQCALFLRLIFSSIGSHFFFEPDTKYRIGFIDIAKSPDKDELFNVKIIRSENDGIINADTLYRYYTGDLGREKKLKGLLDTFIQELINYSQEQEISIGMLSEKIISKKKKQEKKKK